MPSVNMGTAIPTKLPKYMYVPRLSNTHTRWLPISNMEDMCSMVDQAVQDQSCPHTLPSPQGLHTDATQATIQDLCKEMQTGCAGQRPECG